MNAERWAQVQAAFARAEARTVSLDVCMKCGARRPTTEIDESCLDWIACVAIQRHKESCPGCAACAHDAGKPLVIARKALG